MAAVVYDFDRFSPRENTNESQSVTRQRRKIRVVKGKKTRGQFGRMMRLLLGAICMVTLMGGVLYTQARVTELQTRIAEEAGKLDEENAMYAYLTFELNNMSTQRSIEERAEELGLVKMNSNQISYVQVEDDNTIEVKEGPLESLFDKAETGLLSAMDYLSPQDRPQEETQETPPTSGEEDAQ